MTGVCNAGILGYTQAEVDSLLSTKVTGIAMGANISIHVAKTGNDKTGDGSIDKPVLTIAKAIAIAETYFGHRLIYITMYMMK